MSRLRRLLERDRSPRSPSLVLPLIGGGYALRLPAEQVDLTQFRKIVGLAKQSRAAGDLPATADLLGRALRLWRGMPLAGITALAGHPKVVALAGERDAALALYAETTIAAGLAADALPILSEAAAAQPLDEAAQARLIRGYHAVGQRAAAVACYQKACRQLADELGVDPGPELQAAYAELVQLPEPDAAPGGVRPSGPTAPPPVSAPPPVPVVVPAQLPADVAGFVGRAEHLARLDALLAAGRSEAATAVVITAVAGTAGVGKTALAVHWAHRVRGQFPDGQLYVNLRGFDQGGRSMDPGEAIRQFLDALGVPAERIPAEPDARSALYRTMLAGRRMLIVLDNARDAEQVRPLLPGSPDCFVLISSRNTLLGLVAAHGAHSLALDLLSPAEAHELLVTRLGGARIGAEPTAVADIITGCARLPLALAIAAARVATQQHLRLEALAGELRDIRARIPALSGDDPQTDVRTVLSWSYAALSAEAGRLFRLLGLHPGPSITLPAATSLAARPAEQVGRLLTELTLANLITAQPDGRYSFHDLLRSYATDLAHSTDSDGDRRAATNRILDHYLQSADAADRALSGTSAHLRIAIIPAQPGVVPERPTDSGAALRWFAAERVTMLAALARAAATGFDQHAWQLAWTMRIFLNRQGHWDDLATTGRAALAAAQRQADPVAQVRAHRDLARAHAGRGRLEAAHAQLARALELATRAGDDLGQSGCHANLVPLLIRLGRHAEALDHAGRHLELEERAGHPAGIAGALNHVGWAHAHIGDHARALDYCERSLALYERAGTPSNRAAALDSLGYAHRHLGHTAEAVDCYRRALAIFHELGDLGQEANTLTTLGDTLYGSGDATAARRSWQQALEILTNLHHPDAGALRAKLAASDEPGTETHGAGPLASASSG